MKNHDGNWMEELFSTFGPWQARAVFIIFLTKIPASWFMACIIYTAPIPKPGEFYCKPPVPITQQNVTNWVKISHPAREVDTDEELSIDFCNVYEDALEHSHQHFRNASIKPWIKPEENAKVVPCDSFEHHTDYHSVVTQFDLVCSRNILVAVTQFFHLLGVLLGGIIATMMMALISPKRVMVIGMYTQILVGCLTGLIDIFWCHALLRCLAAICCGLMYTAGGVIFKDITTGRTRTIIICTFEQFWSIGLMLLTLLSRYCSSWSYIYFGISLPTVLLIMYESWIPDSPTWLLLRGRFHETSKVLTDYARSKHSNVTLPVNLEDKLKIHKSMLTAIPCDDATWCSLWLDKSSRFKVLYVHLTWAIIIIVYYGLLLNVRVFNRDYLEINTIVAGLCEIIGTFIGLYLILKWNQRKWLIAGVLNVLGATVGYTAWYIPPTVSELTRNILLMSSSMVPKTAISCLLALLTTCTAELTTSSNKSKELLNLSTVTFARFWLLLAPFIGATAVFEQLLPQSVLCGMTIVAGLFAILIGI